MNGYQALAAMFAGWVLVELWRGRRWYKPTELGPLRSTPKPYDWQRERSCAICAGKTFTTYDVPCSPCNGTGRGYER